MSSGREINHHFKQLTAGVPVEVLAALGSAVLAVDAQRRGAESDAPAQLRRAWLELTRWLIRNAGAQLNEQQCVFLLSGALGDTVVIKAPDGKRVTVELLPTDYYEGLLSSLRAPRPPAVLTPRARMAWLAEGHLPPLDLQHPGRYREPTDAERQQADADQLKRRLDGQLQELARTQERLAEATRRFADTVKPQNLRTVLESAQAINELAGDAVAHAEQPELLQGLSVPADVTDHPVVRAAAQLETNLVGVLRDLSAAQQEALQGVGLASQLAGTIVRASSTGSEALAAEDVLTLTPQAAKLVENDYVATNTVMTQLLLNSPQRSAWSASRVLLAEHTERCDDPLGECYATPERLAESIAKVDALHPNCFPHDAAGQPLLPPIIISPGVGEVKWFDDRFLVGFVCTEPARRGSQLTLSPVDLAVMQIYGQFLARGDMFNYRGERITDNFIGEYSGEIEQKAAVKFTGEKKKLTYTTATEVRDAASRDDAVRDYIDFIYHVYNAVQLPKRITPRRVGVLLKYCTIGDKVRTAALALKHVVGYDPLVAREIVTELAGKEPQDAVELLRRALESDPQLASKYGRNFGKIVETVLGHEYAQQAEVGGPAAETADTEQPLPEAPPADEHDYFDV
jgi:hypothetical protein